MWQPPQITEWLCSGAKIAGVRGYGEEREWYQKKEGDARNLVCTFAASEREELVVGKKERRRRLRSDGISMKIACSRGRTRPCEAFCVDAGGVASTAVTESEKKELATEKLQRAIPVTSSDERRSGLWK